MRILRPVIFPADWSISRLQSWTCLSLSTVAEFVKLTQSIVVEAQRQSADLYKVQLCNRQFFVVSTAIYMVKVYECHPLDSIHPVAILELKRGLVAISAETAAPTSALWILHKCTSWVAIEGFHVTSYQANFASHHTCNHHVGFLLA